VYCLFDDVVNVSEFTEFTELSDRVTGQR